MKISSTNKTLFAVAVFLALVAAASFLPQIKNRNAPRQTTTALLNPNYADIISEITIATQDETLTLTKNSGAWAGEQGDIIFPVQDDRVKRLIDALKKIRKLQSSAAAKNPRDRFHDKITSITYVLPENLQTSDKSQNHEKIVENAINNIKKYMKIDFFNEISVSNRRILSLPDDNTLFETDDDFREFLTASANSWAEPFLVSSSIFGNVSDDDIQYIAFTDAQDAGFGADSTGAAKLLSPSTGKFGNAATQLLRLRHGGVCESPLANEFSSSKNYMPAAASTLTLGKGDGTFLRIFFWRQSDGSFIVTYFLPSDFAALADEPHAANTKFTSGYAALADESYTTNTTFARQYNFAVRISGWTYENIVKMFD